MGRGQGDGNDWALFSGGALRSGAWSSQLLRARDWEAAIIIPIPWNSAEAFREQKLRKANLSGLLSLAPDEGGAIENHYNRPLPQKIDKKSSQDQVHLPRRAAEFQRKRKQSTELMAFSP